MSPQEPYLRIPIHLLPPSLAPPLVSSQVERPSSLPLDAPFQNQAHPNESDELLDPYDLFQHDLVQDDLKQEQVQSSKTPSPHYRYLTNQRSREPLASSQAAHACSSLLALVLLAFSLLLHQTSHPLLVLERDEQACLLAEASGQQQHRCQNHIPPTRCWHEESQEQG